MNKLNELEAKNKGWRIIPKRKWLMLMFIFPAGLFLIEPWIDIFTGSLTSQSGIAFYVILSLLWATAIVPLLLEAKHNMIKKNRLKAIKKQIFR